MSELITSDTDFGGDDFQQLVQQCAQLSAFELFRLSAALEVMLDDPQRIQRIKPLVRVGDQIEYFDADKNRCVPAVVRDCRRTRVGVTNLDDGRHWSIMYSSINVDGLDVAPPASDGAKLTRAELAIGDAIGFRDRQGVEHAGVVRKLNPKTVRIDCDGTSWRVGYGLLFRILDADAQPTAHRQLLLGSDFSPAAVSGKADDEDAPTES